MYLIKNDTNKYPLIKVFCQPTLSVLVKFGLTKLMI